MTEAEAVALFRASPRKRRRNMAGVALFGALFGSIVTTLLFVWIFDEPWDSAAIRGAVWLVGGGLVGWWIAATDDVSKIASTVEAAVPAVLEKVDGQQVTVRLADGTALVWSVQERRELSAEVGEALWLSSPAARGKHVLALTDAIRDGQEAPTVLWPFDVAWTTGRGG